MINFYFGGGLGIIILISSINACRQADQFSFTTPMTWISPDLKLVLNLSNSYAKLGRKIISTVVILMRLNNELIISVLTFSKIYSFNSWHCVIQSFESLPEIAEQRKSDTSSSGDDNFWLNWETINDINPNRTSTNLTDIRRTESWDDEISKVFQGLLEFEDDLTLKKGGDGVSTSLSIIPSVKYVKDSHWSWNRLFFHDASIRFHV